LETHEETLRRLVTEMQMLEGTAEEIQTRMNIVDSAITELRVSGDTLDGLKDKTKGDSIFVPIGGGSYVKAKVDDVKKVIIGIGAGVAVEKKIEEARGSIEDQLKDLEKLHGNLQQQLIQVAQAMEETRSKVDEISGNLRKTEAGKKL